jgi:hypothetical protein
VSGLVASDLLENLVKTRVAGGGEGRLVELGKSLGVEGVLEVLLQVDEAERGQLEERWKGKRSGEKGRTRKTGTNKGESELKNGGVVGTGGNRLALNDGALHGVHLVDGHGDGGRSGRNNGEEGEDGTHVDGVEECRWWGKRELRGVG